MNGEVKAWKNNLEFDVQNSAMWAQIHDDENNTLN